jgi:hypothetical protein
MNLFLAIFICVSGVALSNACAQSVEEWLVTLPLVKAQRYEGEWMVDPCPFAAQIVRTADGKGFLLDNGLVRRAFRVSPNGATVGFENLMTGQAMLRSVRPEARVTIDGQAYDVGGLTGQPNHAYLSDEWLEAMTAEPGGFVLVDIHVDQPVERFGWNRRRHHAPDAKWPPTGVRLRMDFVAPAETTLPPRDERTATPNVGVSVFYELYDGIPLISKWITVQNRSSGDILLDRFTVEELAAVEQVNWVENREGVPIPHPDYLHVETDFAFGGFNHEHANRHVVHWRTDPWYQSQVNYERQTPCLLVCEPTRGPAQLIRPGETFESFRVFELVMSGGGREERGLALRRMYRTIAPWVTENPLTHHLLSNNPDQVRRAIDDAAEVGFEAIILSFGSGFNMESPDPDYMREWKDVADYAESRGIELGSYSLFSSRHVGDDNMIVSPPGQHPTHGQCPAVTSEWGQRWLKTIRAFYDQSGFDQFENDGPYPGDVDVTARPPFQMGELDSQWVQGQMINRLYRDLRSKGIYINAPDYYYLNGTNKCGMGYREVNWSLPREQQVIHTRQNIFDGTWEKAPSMGWMFVPLTEYHGGGAAATIEPLSEHLDHYRKMLQSNLGLGVQAHYRGPRLFDTDTTREMVREQVVWFKKYRDILESDLIHGRRADGRNLDWMLHVNPALETKGMLCVYNPTSNERTETLRIDLRFTGLREEARVSCEDRETNILKVSSDGMLLLPATVPAQGMTWWVIR